VFLTDPVSCFGFILGCVVITMCLTWLATTKTTKDHTHTGQDMSERGHTYYYVT
jgi:hypothetical protein